MITAREWKGNWMLLWLLMLLLLLHNSGEPCVTYFHFVIHQNLKRHCVGILKSNEEKIM
jgi:hypothetical protein